MLALAVLVAGIGVADSINPSTIGPALYLATRERAVARLLAFTAGAVAVSLAAGLILTLGPGQALLRLVPRPGPRVVHSVELAVGAALVVIAVVLWFVRDRVSQRILAEEPRLGRSAFLAGGTIIAVELPTALPYFAAIAAIIASGRSVPAQVVLLLVFNLAFVAPLLAITLVRAVAGERARRPLDAARHLLDRHSGAIVAAVVLLIGVALVAVGAVGIAT
jgi:cytochrome c biogenesis protein CcdA